MEPCIVGSRITVSADAVVIQVRRLRQDKERGSKKCRLGVFDVSLSSTRMIYAFTLLFLHQTLIISLLSYLTVGRISARSVLSNSSPLTSIYTANQQCSARRTMSSTSESISPAPGYINTRPKEDCWAYPR